MQSYDTEERSCVINKIGIEYIYACYIGVLLLPTNGIYRYSMILSSYLQMGGR